MTVSDEYDIVYATCTEPGVAVLEALFDHGYPITEIVSIRPETAAEHGVCKYADVSSLASERGVSVYYPTGYAMDEDEDERHFENIEGDLLIVNGWQRLVPGSILETFTRGALGNHGSAMGLPKGRGRSPLNWSLIQGYERFLLSVIRLDPGADSGEIVTTRKFDITEHDTIETLYYKVTMLMKEMLLSVTGPILRNEFSFENQREDPTYYPKRTPEDGEIHWGNSTKDIYNLVRAVADPYPEAFTFCNDQRVTISNVVPFSFDIGQNAETGTVLDVFWTDEFVVATPDGTVLVTEWDANEWTPEAGMRFDSQGEHDRVDTLEQRHHLSTDG